MRRRKDKKEHFPIWKMAPSLNCSIVCTKVQSYEHLVALNREKGIGWCNSVAKKQMIRSLNWCNLCRNVQSYETFHAKY